MRGSHPTSLRAALALVRLASRIVPRGERERWRAEWKGELVHLWRRRVESTKAGRRARLGSRTVIAVIDAMRVRVERLSAAGGARRAQWGRAASLPGEILGEARFALRTWRKHPVQTAAVLLTLALGVGANTAVFSVVNAVLLNPLPYAGADRMVQVFLGLQDLGDASAGLPYGHLAEIERRSTTLERFAVVEVGQGTLGEDEAATPLRVGATSPGLFEALGLGPLIGRSFVAADSAGAGQPVVLMGEALWRTGFGGRPSVLGTPITVDGLRRTVVGVVPERMRYFREDVGLWVPIASPAPDDEPSVYAWRAAGVSLTGAQAEMETIEFQDPELGRTTPLLERPAEQGDDTRALLYATLMAVSIVLLIASVNVAHLTLARSMARRGEMAVRTALGASRARIARLIVVEGGLLTLGGGLLGALLALWSVSALGRAQPESFDIAFDEARIDRTLVLYSALVLILTWAVATLAAVVDAWRTPHSAIRRDGTTSVAPGRGGLVRTGLLIVEVAFSVTLLVGAGVLVHSLIRLQTFDPGFEPEGLFSKGIAVERVPTDAPDRAVTLDRLLDEASAIPGLGGVALANSAPPHVNIFAGTVEVQGSEEVHERLFVSSTRTAPGYFETLGIPLLGGRDFEASDATSAEYPVILDRTLADRFFPGTSAVGRSFRRTAPPAERIYRVVGVVGSATQVDPQLQDRVQGQVYAPIWTVGTRSDDPPDRVRVTLLVRGAPGVPLPVQALAERLRPLGVEMNGETGFNAIRDRLSSNLGGPRFNVVLFGAFAAIALALAIVGLYGVMSQTVERRRREMGIRQALGARGDELRRMIVLQGMAPVLVGVLAGLGGGALAVQLMAGILYLVEPVDPPVFAIVPPLMLAVALAAIWIPALRATRAGPLEVGRSA